MFVILLALSEAEGSEAKDLSRMESATRATFDTARRHHKAFFCAPPAVAPKPPLQRHLHGRELTPEGIAVANPNLFKGLPDSPNWPLRCSTKLDKEVCKK